MLNPAVESNHNEINQQLSIVCNLSTRLMLQAMYFSHNCDLTLHTKLLTLEYAMNIAIGNVDPADGNIQCTFPVQMQVNCASKPGRSLKVTDCAVQRIKT